MFLGLAMSWAASRAVAAIATGRAPSCVTPSVVQLRLNYCLLVRCPVRLRPIDLPELHL